MSSRYASEHEMEEFPILSSIEIQVPGTPPVSRQLRRSEKSARGSTRVAPEVAPTPGKHENLFKSGALGRCNDPLCTTCPAYFDDYTPPKRDSSLRSRRLTGWIRKLWLVIPWLWRSVPRGIINPHARFMQRWTKFFVISCLVGVFVDPLFFFLLSADEKRKCIVIDDNASTVIVVLRSITDTVYLINMLFQFRLAYTQYSYNVREATSLSLRLGRRNMDGVSATREVIDDPKKIAWKYLTGWFLLDLIAVLPIPQIMMKVVLPRYLGKAAGANYAKNVLRVVLLLQNVPRIIRILPFLFGTTSGFETAWANFVINLLLYLLAAHVVGSLWYLFGLQRVNQCMHNACTNATRSRCNREFLDCGVADSGGMQERYGDMWTNWTVNENATGCFNDSSSVFQYGIYQTAVGVTTQKNGLARYIYSVFWGFQQISTLANNQIPSLFVWEILFIMAVMGLGLALLTLLIGNMQSFLQSLDRRALEMQLRRYESEKWMARHHLPLELQRRVKQYERFTWAATKGVREDELLDDLPEDLQKLIRKTLFKDLVKKVRILEVMDEQLRDAIFQRLNQKLYTQGSEIVRSGAPVERMLFVLHGTMKSDGYDGAAAALADGDICGEELLAWCLERASRAKRRVASRSGQRPISSRTITCLSNVEAFSLEARDIEEVTQDFDRLLRNPTVQAAIRYESHVVRSWAARTIQVYWRYKKRKQLRNEANVPRSSHVHQRRRYHQF